MTEENLQEVLEYLEELKEDNTISKNVREKIRSVIETLSQQAELSLKINKAMQILDDISEDIAIQSYTRTQIWNIVSMLESIS